VIYAIGDIHGRPDELGRLLDLIAADGGPDAPVVLLGDLVDRGPDARGVLEMLIAGLAEGRPWTVLRGNHDRMFLRAVRDGVLTDPAIRSGATWLHPGLGGAATLASYGVAAPDSRGQRDPAALRAVREAAREAVPAAHLDFVAERPVMHVTEDHVFVHAGIRPGVALEAQVEDDLVWLREPFLSDRRDHGRLVVHGHTALPRARHHGNRLNLDSGGGYGDPATAALIDGRRAWALGPRGRRELTPEP
jgi:serine/threonine protein phosphatase 1